MEKMFGITCEFAAKLYFTGLVLLQCKVAKGLPGLIHIEMGGE